MGLIHTHTHTDTYPFNGPFSGTTRVSRYQKGKTNLDFTEARDSEWQCHQLGHMQVCTSLQTDNHASTPPLCFLQAGCPSCRPTNSVKALKAVVVVLSAKKISSQSAFERTQNYRIVPYHKRSTRLSYVHQDLDLADEDYEKLEEKNRALVRVVTKLSSR